MSLEFAYRFRRKTPPRGLADLDRVVLTADVVSDDGATIPVGTKGTIVSVHDGGATYAVEFSDPAWAIATVEPHEIKPIGNESR